MGWTIRGSNPGKGSHFCLLQSGQKCSGAHPAVYSVHIRAISQTQSGCGVKMTNLHYLVPELRMSGDLLPLPLSSWFGQTQLYFYQ